MRTNPYYSLFALCFTITVVVVQCTIDSAQATINVIVRVPEGIVVATDSRIYSKNIKNSRLFSENGKKLFQVGSHSVVAVNGMISIDADGRRERVDHLIPKLIEQSGIKNDKEVTIDSISSIFKEYFCPLLTRAYLRGTYTSKLNLILVGIGESSVSKIIEHKFDKITKMSNDTFVVSARVIEHAPNGKAGSIAFGQDDVWYRVVNGYDRKLADWTIVRHSRTIPGSIDTLLLDSIKPLIDYEMMNLQDAIDFSAFIVTTTMKVQSFDASLEQNVGGTIDVATITRSGVVWVQEKLLELR